MGAFAPCGDSGIQAPFICDSAISEGLQGPSLQPVEEKRESVEASGKCNLGVGVGGRVGKGWQLPLRDNPIVRSRVKAGGVFFVHGFLVSRCYLCFNKCHIYLPASPTL